VRGHTSFLVYDKNASGIQLILNYKNVYVLAAFSLVSKVIDRTDSWTFIGQAVKLTLM
jgi:hypothetical protein